jgi:integrase
MNLNLPAVTLSTSTLLAAQSDDRAAFLRSWLAGKSQHTQRAYRQAAAALGAFAASTYGTTSDDALRDLLSLEKSLAVALVLAWKSSMEAAVRAGSLAAATANQRLASVRSLVKVANLVGLVEWTLAIPGMKRAPSADRRGCGVDGVRAMLRAAKSRRDRVAIRLMFENGLRRSEVVGIDCDGVDVVGCSVSILGKGRTGRESVPMSPSLRDDVAALVAEVGGAGALFRNQSGGRLSADGLHHIVGALGKSLGLGAVRPHGLRHTGATHLISTQGPRAAQRWARHADIRTTMLYDDDAQNRRIVEDAGRMLAAMLGDAR